jgi:hypothetical protein
MPYPSTVDVGRYSGCTTNIKDWGAIGDGISDDTNAIANAINYVVSLGGGSVVFPAGTYITGTQLLYSKVHLIGSGIEATIIKLKSGTNADLLKGSINGYGATFVNISAANGTGSTGGIYNWSLQNLTLDGNKAGQSSGPSYCCRQYGFGFIIQNVRMRNGYSGGLLSDWNGGSSSGVDSMEAQIINLKIHDCNAIGFEWGIVASPICRCLIVAAPISILVLMQRLCSSQTVTVLARELVCLPAPSSSRGAMGNTQTA